MSTITQSQFVADLLRGLGVAGAADDVPGNATSFAQRKLTSKLEELQRRNLVDWDITSDIPSSMVDALEMIMSPVVGPTFGKGIPQSVLEQGEKLLVEMVRGSFRDRDDPTDY